MSGPRIGCERARSGEIQVNGLRLHLLEWGRAGAPPLCFLHGGAAHAHWFDAVAPAFADRYHVISLDQRGHGESEWAEPPAYASEDFAADLLAVLDALGWPRVALVGHSMGGHNAMSFAAWHPERVNALVIVDSRPAIPAARLDVMHARGHRPVSRYPSAEAALRAFRLLPRDTVADPALIQHLAAAAIVERDGCWIFRFDPQCNGSRRPADGWQLLSRITAPTLIVRGELSPVLPRDTAARMQAAISHATVIEIPGAYHHLILDRPEAFSQALTPFLSRALGQ